jgi:hypothetical protein
MREQATMITKKTITTAEACPMRKKANACK